MQKTFAKKPCYCKAFFIMQMQEIKLTQGLKTSVLLNIVSK